MTDSCENISQSPSDGTTIGQKLLCSQQNIYNDLDRRYRDPHTSPEARNLIMQQMSEVASTIIKLTWERSSRQDSWPSYGTQRIEIGRSVDTTPSVIQMQLGINSSYNSPQIEDHARMQDYEAHGVTFFYSHNKMFHELNHFDKLSSVSEISEDDSYSEHTFNGILKNNETKRIRLNFGRYAEEFNISYIQGVLNLKGTRSYPQIDQSILVNMGELQRNNGIQKIVINNGNNYRMVLFFRLTGQ